MQHHYCRCRSSRQPAILRGVQPRAPAGCGVGRTWSTQRPCWQTHFSCDRPESLTFPSGERQRICRRFRHPLASSSPALRGAAHRHVLAFSLAHKPRGPRRLPYVRSTISVPRSVRVLRRPLTQEGSGDTFLTFTSSHCPAAMRSTLSAKSLSSSSIRSRARYSRALDGGRAAVTVQVQTSAVPPVPVPNSSGQCVTDQHLSLPISVDTDSNS